MDVQSFYENTQYKYGFDDGENQPAYYWLYRKALVNAINRLLPKESVVEAYEYDRPGCHNSCLICWRYKSERHMDSTLPASLGGPKDAPEPEELGSILYALEKLDFLNEVVILREPEIAPLSHFRELLKEARGIAEDDLAETESVEN